MSHFQKIIRIIAFTTLWLARAQNGFTIAPASLPYGSVGNVYSAQINSNGSPATQWNLAGGAFPPGLALSSIPGSSTTISGTPSTVGSYSFTLSATDPDLRNATTTQGFSISIAQINPASPLPTATLNVPYSATFTISTGGNFTWQCPNPPSGLTMSAQGVLGGTPTSTGTFNFMVTAVPVPGAAFVGPSVSAAYQLTVVPGLAFTSSVILPNGVSGSNYAFLLMAQGGTQPYTFTVEPSGPILNALPAGLTLAVGGLISGVPTTPGNYGFAIDVTDANKITASGFFQLIIAPPFSINTPSPLPTASLQASYTQAITATGGNFPYTFSLAKGSGPLPIGLTLQPNGTFSGVPTVAGTSTFTVQATDNVGYVATKQFQLSVAAAGPLLQVSPLQLTFSAVAGDTDSPPAPQIISIIAPSGAPVNYSVALQGTPAPQWIKVAPATGSAPGAVVVSVSASVPDASGNPASLAPGVYPATLLVSVPGNAGQAPISVQVILTITTGKPPIQVAPTLLRFFGRTAAPSTQEQIIVIEDSGGGGSPAATIVQGSTWITLPKSSGLTVRVDVNTQGLGVGNYHDIVRLTNAAGTVDVAVSLFVAAPGPVMSVSATGLRFQSRQGAGTTETQTVNVLNLGDPTSAVNFIVDLVTGGNWLTIAAPGSGSATPSQPGSFMLVPAASTANLPAGPQYALVRVTDSQSQNSPQYLTAVLDNQPATAPALPDPTPAGLYFASTTGAQSVFVNTSSITPVPFQTTAITSDGAAWLAVTPATGNASTSNAGLLSIAITPAAVSGPGIYHGSVNVAMNGVERVVNVTMVVPPSGTVKAAIQPATTAANCTPSHLAISQTGLLNNFSVPAGWPASLIVQLNDDCGNAVTNGSVAANFSNGDPPLTLPGDHTTNIYSSTWQPGATFPEMTVTVQASAGTLPQAVQQFTGSVSQNTTPPPSLVPNGALNIFFDNPTANAAGRALAPGDVIQVYGNGLAAALTSPGVVPLLNQISGTYMLIGKYQVPLFFVAGSVLAAQVPFELMPNQQYPAIVSVNNALTLPQTLDIAPMQPGVLFNVADQTVVAQRPNGSLVSAANPAKPGETLTLYLAGMGPTNPSVTSGSPTPLQQILVTQQPTVSLGGETVNVTYAGLTPTGIGLYQINFMVPADAKPGLLPLNIVQGTVTANATLLPVGTP